MGTDLTGRAGGTFRIFLPNGTHVTGSCGETYRLDRWRSVSPTRLIVTEDVGQSGRVRRVEFEVAFSILRVSSDG